VSKNGSGGDNSGGSCGGLGALETVRKTVGDCVAPCTCSRVKAYVLC
jgi:hypothetical protein